MLNRLLKKHAVRAALDGRRYLYTPAIERVQWQGTVSEGFVDRVFGGRLVPLVAHRPPWSPERRRNLKSSAA